MLPRSESKTITQKSLCNSHYNLKKGHKQQKLPWLDLTKKRAMLI